MKIIFVCTGNTCRSAMAEGIAREVFSWEKLPIEVESRGVSVHVPLGASDNAVLALKRQQIDISNHISRPICAKDIEDADLILTMTQSHKQVLKGACREKKKPLYTLMEFIGEKEKEVADPFGRDLADYEICAKEIMDCVKKIPSILQQLNYL